MDWHWGGEGVGAKLLNGFEAYRGDQDVLSAHWVRLWRQNVLSYHKVHLDCGASHIMASHTDSVGI